MTHLPMLSIVTVTFQDIPGLRRTLCSLEHLAKEAGRDLEVLIVDGGSGPKINEIARDFPWAQFRSEDDNGIYDAMNKGLERSTGSYLWFLNGGDECLLTKWPPLKKELLKSPESIVLCGYVLAIGTRLIKRLPRRPSYIWHGLPTSHQSIFYPTSQARGILYDPRYKMVGDYQFTSQLLANGASARQSNIVVAQFQMDGFSFQQAHLVAREATIVQREVLRTSVFLRLLSRCRHNVSRMARRAQARLWAPT